MNPSPLTPTAKRKAIQEILGVPADGIFGEKETWPALRALAAQKDFTLPGAQTLFAPGWKFTLTVEGDDLVARGVTATWFGGPHDDLDNGETMSGVDNRKYGVLGVALPIAHWVKSTVGSPLPQFPPDHARVPKIPFGTIVEVTRNAVTLALPLIDNGPAASAEDAIDCTPAAFEKLGGTMRQGVITVDYRIVGGAKYL